MQDIDTGEKIGCNKGKQRNIDDSNRVAVLNRHRCFKLLMFQTILE